MQDADGDIVLTGGLQRLQLGTLDIFQSADFINDSLSDTYTQDINRQGYPMLSLKFFTESSKFSFFYLPYFYRPYYPANSARMGFGLEFDQQLLVGSDGTYYKSGSTFTQYGLKLDHSTEHMDLSLSYFHLADRSLTFSYVDENFLLTRYFFESDLFLAAVEGNIAETIIKANVLFKSYAPMSLLTNDQNVGTITQSGPRDHTIASIGLETKWNLISGHDTSWLLEHQRILGTGNDITDRYSVFGNDISWGIRHQFNDTMNKQILMVHIIDLAHTEEQIFQCDYRQNLNDQFKFSLGGRLIQAKSRTDESLGFDNLNGLTIVEDADTIYTTLSFVY